MARKLGQRVVISCFKFSGNMLIAEQAGFSYKYYQAIEAGRKRELRLSTLDRLAKAHGMET